MRNRGPLIAQQKDALTKDAQTSNLFFLFIFPPLSLGFLFLFLLLSLSLILFWSTKANASSGYLFYLVLFIFLSINAPDQLGILHNGTLSDHLHGSSGMGPSWIAWPDRLRITTEIMYVLSYMHYAKSKPIMHKDVNSSNIFLDENYTAKLSNFGVSVSIFLDDETSSIVLIARTYGYIDPEYLQMQRIIEKCDVFGLVLYWWNY